MARPSKLSRLSSSHSTRFNYMAAFTENLVNLRQENKGTKIAKG